MGTYELLDLRRLIKQASNMYGVPMSSNSFHTESTLVILLGSEYLSSPVYAVVPYEVKRVKKQEAREDLHKQLPAGRGQLGHHGAPQALEQRGGGQDGGQVPAQHPHTAGQPLAKRWRRTRARSDPPHLDPLPDTGQRVQREERCAKEHVYQKGVRRGQVRGEQDVLFSYTVPESLQDRRGCLSRLGGGYIHRGFSSSAPS